MVTHAVYQDQEQNYVSVSDVGEKNGKHFDKFSGSVIHKGPVVKMSKSKKNTVDPNSIITEFGADVARWFVLSDSPPERDFEWTDAGVLGASRFTQKVWKLAHATLDENGEPSDEARCALQKMTQKCLLDITTSIEGFKFNVAVAKIHELTGALARYNWQDDTRDEAIEILIKVLSPFMPHLAESCWQKIGNTSLLVLEAWPEADSVLCADELILMPVQINGKKRAEIEISSLASKADILTEALENKKVKSIVGLSKIDKSFIVQGRLINLVVSQ